MNRPLYTVENGWPKPDIGAMIHQITIQQLTEASPLDYDTAGPVETWEDFLDGIFAAIEPMRGSDVIRAGQTTTKNYVEIVMWYQPGILSNMRVVTDAENTYIIQSITNVRERNVLLVLNCLGLGAND